MMRAMRFGAVAAFLAAGLASAQERHEDKHKEDPAKTPHATRAHQAQIDTLTYGVMTPQENDARIARWLEIDNRGVVECSKDAESKATNPKVKEFAARMVADHNKCLEDLKKFHVDMVEKTRAYVDPSKKTDPEDEKHKNGALIRRDENAGKNPDSRTAVVIRDEGRVRDNKMFFTPTDFVSVKEDVCREMGSEMKKMMGELKGEAYDTAYMEHAIAGHYAMIATLKSVRPSASADFQKHIDEGIAQLKTHLTDAKAICNEVSNHNHK